MADSYPVLLISHEAEGFVNKGNHNDTNDSINYYL